MIQFCSYDVVHFIPTVVPPVIVRACGLHPAEHRINEQEFDCMLDKDIFRLSKIDCVSLLHMNSMSASDWSSTISVHT